MGTSCSSGTPCEDGVVRPSSPKPSSRSQTAQSDDGSRDLSTFGKPTSSSSASPKDLSMTKTLSNASQKGPSSSLSSYIGLAARRSFAGKASSSIDISTKKETPKSRRRINAVQKFTDFYELGKELMPSCHTGMFIMYAARKTDKEEVVIKVRLKKDSFANDQEENEWRMSTEFMLNLPETQGIAKLYEVLEDDKGYYVVMEKVAGQDLFETVTGNGVLSVTEVREVLRQLLDALRELHDRGCIHKDLKLENIMFERSPPPGAKNINWDALEGTSPVQVKLIDFDTVENVTPATPKRSKDVLGTDQYIAQEAYAGMYSTASDIFAAGVIGYRLLTSRFPFDSRIFNDEAGENWVGSPKMREIREKLRHYRINWSDRVFVQNPQAKDLLMRMLASAKEDRPTAQQALAHTWLNSGS